MWYHTRAYIYNNNISHDLGQFSGTGSIFVLCRPLIIAFLVWYILYSGSMALMFTVIVVVQSLRSDGAVSHVLLLYLSFLQLWWRTHVSYLSVRLLCGHVLLSDAVRVLVGFSTCAPVYFLCTSYYVFGMITWSLLAFRAYDFVRTPCFKLSGWTLQTHGLQVNGRLSNHIKRAALKLCSIVSVEGIYIYTKKIKCGFWEAAARWRLF